MDARIREEHTGPVDGNRWVRILCDKANLIDSNRLVAFGLSGSIACG